MYKRRYRSRSNRGYQKRSKPKTQGLHRSLYVSHTNPEPQKEEVFVGTPYSNFDFNQNLAKNLQVKGFKSTTKIQDMVIPLILEGKDILGISKTGSGKTGAFLIPMIEKLLNDRSEKMLVIAPTRELAEQILKEAISLLRGTKIYAALVIGGENMNRQIAQLRKSNQLIIGTPGRLKDLIERQVIKPDNINNIVVDEVDRMLDMGFINDVRWMFRRLAPKKQALFFSATHNDSVETIVSGLIGNFELIKLANNTPNDSVEQSIIEYGTTSEKFTLLHELLSKDEVQKAIIFVETKRFADNVEKSLKRESFKVGVIHGDKRQNQRKRVIDTFRRSNIKYLVATNVAARGIDIDDITHVINLDEPSSYDEYIHRIGRAGRNGETGRAYTFVQVDINA